MKGREGRRGGGQRGDGEDKKRERWGQKEAETGLSLFYYTGYYPRTFLLHKTSQGLFLIWNFQVI